VLAQVWRSPRQAVLSRALRGVEVVANDEKLARRAGELCAAAQTSDVVDALVVATAEVRGGVVITSDPSDIAALASHARGPVRVIAI
jgi:predicted nucleic acid-binding protein